MKTLEAKVRTIVGSTPANPYKATGNPHEYRDAEVRGRAQGRLAAEKKPYSHNPYSPDAAAQCRKRASLTIARSNKNRSAWNTGFMSEAGFEDKVKK